MQTYYTMTYSNVLESVLRELFICKYQNEQKGGSPGGCIDVKQTWNEDLATQLVQHAKDPKWDRIKKNLSAETLKMMYGLSMLPYRKNRVAMFFNAKSTDLDFYDPQEDSSAPPTPYYCIIKVPTLKTWYICLRGTSEPFDWFRDVDAVEGKTTDLWHYNFNLLTNQVSSELTSIIDNTEKPQKLIFAGHSMGAALAAILAYKLSDKFQTEALLLACPKFALKKSTQSTSKKVDNKIYKDIVPNHIHAYTLGDIVPHVDVDILRRPLSYEVELCLTATLSQYQVKPVDRNASSFSIKRFMRPPLDYMLESSKYLLFIKDVHSTFPIGDMIFSNESNRTLYEDACKDMKTVPMRKDVLARCKQHGQLFTEEALAFVDYKVSRSLFYIADKVFLPVSRDVMAGFEYNKSINESLVSKWSKGIGKKFDDRFLSGVMEWSSKNLFGTFTSASIPTGMLTKFAKMQFWKHVSRFLPSCTDSLAFWLGITVAVLVGVWHSSGIITGLIKNYRGRGKDQSGGGSLENDITGIFSDVFKSYTKLLLAASFVTCSELVAKLSTKDVSIAIVEFVKIYSICISASIRTLALTVVQLFPPATRNVLLTIFSQQMYSHITDAIQHQSSDFKEELTILQEYQNRFMHENTREPVNVSVPSSIKRNPETRVQSSPLSQVTFSMLPIAAVGGGQSIRK